jgi:hypothetical protein
MAYTFPGSVTRDGQPIPGGSDITELDYQFAERLYGRAAAARFGALLASL